MICNIFLITLTEQAVSSDVSRTQVWYVVFFPPIHTQLLDAYFSRAQKEQKEKFIRNHGFSLLANQLYMHQGTRGVLECFLGMLFGRTVSLEEAWVSCYLIHFIQIAMFLIIQSFILLLKVTESLITWFFLSSLDLVLTWKTWKVFLHSGSDLWCPFWGSWKSLCMKTRWSTVPCVFYCSCWMVAQNWLISCWTTASSTSSSTPCPHSMGSRMGDDNDSYLFSVYLQISDHVMHLS